MILGISLTILVLIGGIALITVSSHYAVKHSALLAKALGISPLIIGITLVSIGTDVSEIFNSIISCALGHGDIDVGDSVGSDLTQLTLVFGLLPIICGTFFVHRRDIVILGCCEILSLFVIYSVVEKGYFTRLNAIMMVGSLAIFIWLIYITNKESILERVELLTIDGDHRSKKYHIFVAVIGFGGVTISAYAIVYSVITLSSLLSVHEYLISFFMLSIGTSLPELAVDINALRVKEDTIAVGDILGSCIVDSTLSIGIGQALFPQAVTASLAIPTILYTILACLIVIPILALRKTMDRKTGVLFIMIYLGSYFLLFFI